MFPTLSEFFEYFFNIHIRLPIQTLGFFIAVAFVLAFYNFRSELKRYERIGLIHAFTREVVVGQPVSIIELCINATLGFVFGFKIFGILLNYNSFINDPKRYIFSFSGNLLAGLICCVGWALWAYTDRKKNALPEPVIIRKTIHPYQLMIKLAVWPGIWGFIGARLFDCLEHFDKFIHDPIGQLLFYGGYTFYGSFIFGALTYYYIGVKNGLKFVHVADLGGPGITIAYAVGRLGCQLSGDGDWGIVNTHLKPAWLQWPPNWMWSFTFPHNVIHAGEYMYGCTGNYCNQLTAGVYPTSFYEFVMCTLIFAFLWYIRKKPYIGGVMACTTFLLTGAERFLIEFIRVNVRYHLFGISFTQAQLISLISMLIGIGGLIYIFTTRYKRNKAGYTNQVEIGN